MPGHKLLSMRSTLKGEVVDFLDVEKMACLQTQDGLVELISALSYYKEEGKSLFPEIYIFDELEVPKKFLNPFEYIKIGEGDKSGATMLKALKKCAPLTEGGWVIYILRLATKFEYGLFRCGTSIISVPISAILIDDEGRSQPMILVHQVADKIVELKGVIAPQVLINFGINSDSDISPIETHQKFINYIISDIDDKQKEQAKTFLQKLFLEVLHKGHGNLAVVVNSKKRTIPKKLRNGIILSSKINLTKYIEELRTKNDLQANSQLEGCFDLLSGMMQSDGITVFSSDGCVLAYNVFIKHPPNHKTKSNGGARSISFEVLCELIGIDIDAAFIQSQDGKVEYKGNEK